MADQGEAVAPPPPAKRTKQEDREHSRRKLKRRRERGWERLQQVLTTIPSSMTERVRVLRPIAMATHEAGRADAVAAPSPQAAAVAAPSPQAAALASPAAAATTSDWAWAEVPASIAPAATNKRAGIRVQRKRMQVEGFCRILESMFDPAAPLRLVDFGSGTGNLTLPLAWRYPNWTFFGVDMKDKCIELLDGRAAAAKLTNIRGVVGMAADAALPGSDPSFDVALALHACGSATDDVLVRATEPSMAAAFVVSPCCAGKICKSISDAALLGVPPEDFAVIASFADHSNSDNPDSTLPANIQKQKEAKKVIEADRLQFCRQRGYNAALLQLTSDVEYPKNDVLIGSTQPLPVV